MSGSSFRRRVQQDATIARLDKLLAQNARLTSEDQPALGDQPSPDEQDSSRSSLAASKIAAGEPQKEAQARRRARITWTALLLVLAALAAILIGSWVLRPTPSAFYPITSAELTEARAMHGELRVGEPSTTPPYDRTAFGPAWADEDRNGCDTRNDVLARDLLEPDFKPGTNSCVVLTGTLIDRYTDQTIEFQRGQDTSTEVQIDHVVALADAWHQGASTWNASARQTFANDPINLLAVDGPSNQEKGSLDASQWLPPNREFQCQFAVIQIRVKAEYELGVTSSEHRTLGRTLRTCSTPD